MFVLSRQELGCICHRFVSLASFVSLLYPICVTSVIRVALVGDKKLSSIDGETKGILDCNGFVRAQKVELIIDDFS